MLGRITAAAMLSIMVFISFDAAARTKTPFDPRGADWLTRCALADDARTATNPAGGVACCSNSLGYCVVCKAGEKCTKTPTSRVLPGSLRHRLQQGATDALNTEIKTRKKPTRTRKNTREPSRPATKIRK